MKASNKWLMIYCIMLLVGCKNLLNEVPFEELHNWLLQESNGYIEKSEVNDINYQCIFYPAEIYTIHELIKINKDITKSSFDSVIEDYKNSVVVQFRIKIGDGNYNLFNYESSNLQDKSERQFYLANNLKYDFTLKIGDRIYNCIEATSENNFNISPWTDVMLIFNVNHEEVKKHDFILSYNDKLLGTSINNFNFSIQQRKSIPTIVF
jgi:hypothetical protein